MTPNELRIGSIVKLSDSGDIVQVAAITKRKVGFHAPNERPNAHLRYRKLSEIEGVLIRDHWQKIECSELQWIEDSLVYVFRDYPSLYIHELQNIYYALIGEEIKIRL